MIERHHLPLLPSSPVWGVDGSLIGTIAAVYEDGDGSPHFAAVRLSRLRKRCAVMPLSEADFGGVRVRVPYTRVQVCTAPSAMTGWSADLRTAAEQHYASVSAAAAPAPTVAA